MPSAVIQFGNSVAKFIPDDTVEIEQLAALRGALSFKVQGAFFHPRFGKGWDGRKYLMTEVKMEFASGLMQRVQDVCKNIGIDTTLDDRRIVKPSSHYMPMKIAMTLRPYQEEAVNEALSHLCGTLRIATGGGKTRCGCAIIASLEKPALFLVHTRDLLYQVLDNLKELLFYPEIVGQIGDGKYAPNIITVATVQSLAAAYNIKLSPSPDDLDQEKEETGIAAHRAEIISCVENCEVVVIDECHHTPADTIYDILRNMKAASTRIGLSATDWRDDGADMMIEAALGPRLIDVSLSDLISWGYLVPAEIWLYPTPLPPNTTGNAATFAQAYSRYVTRNEAFHSLVVKVNKHFYEQGRTILTLVKTIAHGETLEESHRAAGIPALFVSGKSTMTDRRQALDDMRQKKLRCIIATSIADEGLDLPAADALNLAGGGKSSTRAYQRIGRILRPYPGKSEGLVVDYTMEQNKWLKKHANKRRTIYKREPGFTIHAER